ncbi:MAG TPA: hypothetical protein VIE64_08225 [Solirubrobacterales bacterium]
MPQSLIPGPVDQSSLIGPALAERLEQQVFAPARAAGIENLSVAAVTDPPPPTEARRSPHGTWWVASTFELDPVTVANGGVMEAPAEVVADLRKKRAAGIDFDQVWVLSELPPEWTPGTTPPKMRLAGRGNRGAQVVQTQEAIFAAGLEGLRLAAQAVGLAVRGTAIAGAMAAGAMAEAIALDPVILGGIEDPESGKIAWLPLAAWDETPAT